MTNNLNRTMKLLTSITVLLTIPTIIASFYGMNIALPGQNSPYAVFTIIAVTVGVIFVLLMLFIKNKLL